MEATIGIINAQTFKEENVEIHILDIESYAGEFLEYIINQFVTICEVNSGNKIETVKQRTRRFFESKSENTKMGVIAIVVSDAA